MNTGAIVKRTIKSSITHFGIAILISIAGFSSIQQAHSQINSSEKFSLTLKNADIRSLIETVSIQTGINFIVDPRVKAKITVITSEPVNKDKLYDLFLSVLPVSYTHLTLPTTPYV